MGKTQPIYLAGRWVESDRSLVVANPYNGETVGTTFLASRDQLEEAIVAAESVFPQLAATPTYDRVKVLHAFATKLRERRDDVARLIALEAGKPIKEAEVEADRGIFTVETAAEEAKRIEGDVMPLDLLPSSKGRFGIVRRFPIGPIAGISPFNFPLNLALHKVAPALASGNPIVLKPPSKDPLTMLLVAQILDEIGAPPGAVSVLPMDRETGDAMVADDRFKLLSFTGSPDVGWDMKRRAGMKRVVLELGGNAGVVVDDDADIAFAAQRVRVGAFAYAGQVCISVQRVFVHEAHYERFKELLIAETEKMKLGDPLDRNTDLGPMIDDRAAQRSQQWIEAAVKQGARVLTGGKADGRFFQPTIIENAPKDAFVCSREAFAPLVTLFKIGSFKEGVDALNDSVYGLQAGIFSNRLEHALYAFEHVETGAVIMNDVPTYRIDHMPYGGVKASGLSREGLRYAIEDMTEMRLLVVNRLESQAVS
ncbi:MAG: aldehyde dehydrogenase family protein [Thermomicrobiales bacterium]